MKGSQLTEVDELLTASFGTPDDPIVPAVEGAELLDLHKLKMAAGPVGSDEDGSPRGLYREHCAHCHGITGDGNGPTAAFLNPYPRDYRPGKFKFKSTPIGLKADARRPEEDRARRDSGHGDALLQAAHRRGGRVARFTT